MLASFAHSVTPLCQQHTHTHEQITWAYAQSEANSEEKEGEMTLDGFILHIFQPMHGISEILQRIVHHARPGNKQKMVTAGGCCTLKLLNTRNLCTNRGTEGKEEMKAVMDANGVEQC